MASLVSRQASSLEKTSTLLKFSINFIRNFATAAPPPPTAEDGGGSEPEPKKKRSKKKNLMDVATFLPNWGIGYHVAKTHWAQYGVSYQLTKINLYKSGKHGKAFGIPHKDGVPITAAKKIGGVNKRCWKSLTFSEIEKRKALSSPDPEAQSAPVPEGQPA